MVRDDEPIIAAFNATAAERHCLHVQNMLPAPFIGDPAAPVVLLNLNPGGYEGAFAVLERDT